MSFSINDRELMARALSLAAKGRFTTSPNPAVGCVISKDGKVLGEGYTSPPGGNHAEIEALNKIKDASGAWLMSHLSHVAITVKLGPVLKR